MRAIITSLLVLMDLTLTFAQLSVGNTGITVKTGTTLSVDGLALAVAGPDLTISNNSIEKSTVTVPGGSFGSIRRVYHFQSSLSFSGTAAVRYLSSELNGNPEVSLQIAHSAGSGALVLTTGSTVNTVTHQVSNLLTSTSLRLITAATPSGPLPVTLIRFIAEARENGTFLRWTTAFETNSHHFVVERSTDALNWQELGKVSSAGESSNPVAYQFTDTRPAEGVNYYRLKMVDSDGSFTFSTIQAVDIKSAAGTSVYPNPVQNWLYLTGGSTSKITKVEIYGLSGRLVYESALFPQPGIRLETFPPGTYVLKLRRDNGLSETHTFVKK